MIVAFDYHGVLEISKPLRELAKTLLAGGNEIHIISAISHWQKEEDAKKVIDSWEIPWHGVHFIHFEGAPTPQVSYRVGKMKAEKMKEISADVLFDDNEHICKAVRDEGLDVVFARGQDRRRP